MDFMRESFWLGYIIFRTLATKLLSLSVTLSA